MITSPDVPQRRQWFRFSMRTMFVALTLFSILLGWVGWQWRIVRERERLIQWDMVSGALRQSAKYEKLFRFCKLPVLTITALLRMSIWLKYHSSAAGWAMTRLRK